MQREKANAISALMAMLDVGLALISFNLAIYSDFGQFSFLYNKDSIILQLLVIIIWTFMSTGFKTNILIDRVLIPWCCLMFLDRLFLAPHS